MQCDYSSYEICFQMLIYLVRMVYIFYCWLRMVHIFILFYDHCKGNTFYLTVYCFPCVVCHHI